MSSIIYKVLQLIEPHIHLNITKKKKKWKTSVS